MVLFTRAYAVWGLSKKILVFLALTYVVGIYCLLSDKISIELTDNIGINRGRIHVNTFIHDRSRVTSSVFYSTFNKAMLTGVV